MITMADLSRDEHKVILAAEGEKRLIGILSIGEDSWGTRFEVEEKGKAPAGWFNLAGAIRDYNAR